MLVVNGNPASANTGALPVLETAPMVALETAPVTEDVKRVKYNNDTKLVAEETDQVDQWTGADFDAVSKAGEIQCTDESDYTMREYNDNIKEDAFPNDTNDTKNFTSDELSLLTDDTNANRLRLAKEAPLDEPYGVANIFACLQLVHILSTGAAKDELSKLLGPEILLDKTTLVDRKRKLFALISGVAQRILRKSDAGKAAMEAWKELGTNTMQLAFNVEGQVNELVKKHLDISNMFAPQSIVDDPSFIPLVVLAAMEVIKVEHKDPLPRYESGMFTMRNGVNSPARYAVASNRCMITKTIPGVGNVGGCCIARVESKRPDDAPPEEHRSLLFVLPDNKDDSLDSCLDAIAAEMDKYGLCYFDWSGGNYNFKFPTFDATHNAQSISEKLELLGIKSMFNPEAEPFEQTLPQEAIQEDTGDKSASSAFISKVIHFASFKADRKGAEAKAVTIAVPGYRSLGATPPPLEFNCDRPFIVLLVNGSTGVESVEFVLKVEGKCLDDPARMPNDIPDDA